MLHFENFIATFSLLFCLKEDTVLIDTILYLQYFKMLELIWMRMPTSIEIITQLLFLRRPSKTVSSSISVPLPPLLFRLPSPVFRSLAPEP
jgi:hypothetical protein